MYQDEVIKSIAAAGVIVIIIETSLLSISSQHLKEISDPVGDLLEVVHKIVYISQV